MLLIEFEPRLKFTLLWSHSVLCLHKTICDLKQSGCCWYQKLTEICEETIGLICYSVDQVVFCHCDNSSILIMAVHVNNCTIAAHSPGLVIKLKEKLGSHVDQFGQIALVVGY